jgi:hypothetical protein
VIKRARDLIRDVEALGYEFDHTNSKGTSFYIHPDTGAQVRLPAGVDERVARSVLDDARHSIGLPTKDNKRHPDLIRQRQDAERDLERARQSLASAGSSLTAGSHFMQVAEAEEALRAAERRLAWWDRLVREASGVAV